MTMEQADHIEAFVAGYLREFDYYQELARLGAQRCEELAKENGIRAIVTFRAKRPDALREKLRQRATTRNYHIPGEIREDIVDLSGVRVALYFPADRAKFSSLIADSFRLDPS
jgi:ppGpp synthetase/RelA/SpoT-type nucleotidyltranferase